jgi:ABC-type multidrug transport system ATPase subunit
MNRTNTTPILQADGLNFSYPQRPLFAHFSVAIPPGITLIRGGDGCGKSSLLRLLAGELTLHSGQLRVNGFTLQGQAANYKTQIFWAEPRSDAHDQLTVPDYFELQRSGHSGFDDAVLADVVRGLGLSEHLHKRLYMLSTGSKRKVFLAAAFASGAAVTLLDEPFAALDTASIGFILKWLKGAADDNQRAWVMADYAAPDSLHLAQTIDLGD